MTLDSNLVELMCKVLPKIYSKYVTTTKNGKKVLYVGLEKAIYSLLKSLQFYKQLSKDLTKMGFEINYYNPCVANKLIKVKQMTITWHVDDVKIPHQDSKDVSRMIRRLRKLYGQHGELTVSRGKCHDYLGMMLDYRKKGK